MPTTPTPRSWNIIVAEMTSAFLSRFGLKALKVGSPVLSIIEAAAQSDLRSSQDIFTLLNSIDIEQATGVALDRIGADEGLFRFGDSPSSGVVTIFDSSFTKISTKIYQGQPAPIVGSTTIYVTDASEFTAPSGAIYLGRGTANFEGPIAYSTAPTSVGTYWSIDLDQPTTRFHNIGESVVLAQGGNRNIVPNTLVQTPQGNTVSAIQFSVTFGAVIPDGETEIKNVEVVARTPGVVGNIPADTISSFVNPPFVGAGVTNPLPYSNGQAAEDDKTFRERIKLARQSRSKGTATAIKNAVLGLEAKDENKRILSASVVTRQGFPTTLYIDDGTGYEERSEGIAIETLMDSATGGERFFEVSQKPVAKAEVVSVAESPYALTGNAALSVNVGGVKYVHTFSPEDFKAISNASAYEVVSSINSNSAMAFSARVVGSGTKVALFAKSDTNEDIEVVSSLGIDANAALLFPAGRADTMLLYKNDRLLNKDGKIASVSSNPLPTWGVLSNNETLVIRVDRTRLESENRTPPPLETDEIYFQDQDFIDAGTGFNAVGANTLEAWATVLNFKIPGITAVASNGVIVITSNLGRNGRAAVEIISGTLVEHNFIEVASAFGEDSDYTLDRNTGQIRLDTQLSPGDKLTAGTVYIRSFLESDPITGAGASIPSVTGAKLWFSVDGDATLVATGLDPSSLLSISSSAQTGGQRVTINSVSGFPFANVRVNDWLVLWDDAIPDLEGQWRICYKTPNNQSVQIDVPSAVPITYGSINLGQHGFAFIRSVRGLQYVTVPGPASNLLAPFFVGQLNAQLEGALATVYRTSAYRLSTNTYGPSGDIGLLAQNNDAAAFALEAGDNLQNRESSTASVIAGHPENGTPNFWNLVATAITDQDTVTTVNRGIPFGYNSVATGLHVMDNTAVDTGNREGNNFNTRSIIKESTATNIELRRPSNTDWATADRLYFANAYAMAPTDSLVVVADQDTIGKRFVVPMGRRCIPLAGSSYASTITLQDNEGPSPQSLATAFGTAFNFNDYAIYLSARQVVTAGGTILWRSKRLGADGNSIRIEYFQGVGANVPLAALVVYSAGVVTVRIQLPTDGSSVPVAQTAAQIVAFVNGLGDECPVTAALITAGGPVVAQGPVFLVEGLLYVQTSTYVGPDYTFLIKGPLTLATYILWDQEDVRLVPITTQSITAWMNSQAVTGLSGAAATQVADGGTSPQITSLTPGSGGAIQVQGGTANSVAVPVVGTSTVSGGFLSVTAKKALADNLYAGMWVEVININKMQKADIFTTSTILNSWDPGDGIASFSGTTLFTLETDGDQRMMIQKQGRFACYTTNPNVITVPPDLTLISEGSWAVVTGAANSENNGTFRVVRVVDDGFESSFWVDNPNAVNEEATIVSNFYSSDSLMPGDTITISHDHWGATNKGVWVVEEVPSISSLKVRSALRTPGPIGTVSALTAAEVNLIQIQEAQITHLFKRIKVIYPNAIDPTFSDIIFDTDFGALFIGESSGSVLSALDKLDFSLDVQSGIDGYRHNIGLIAEAQKVVYGYQPDPITYPGVAAAGSNININGPIVKRITVSLAIRARTGIPLLDIADKVRSTSAAVINKSGVGQPIAISDIVSAAASVNGVVGVSVISPTYNSSHDLIPVQPNEKALVLSLEQDILVSFVGE